MLLFRALQALFKEREDDSDFSAHTIFVGTALFTFKLLSHSHLLEEFTVSTPYRGKCWETNQTYSAPHTADTLFIDLGSQNRYNSGINVAGLMPGKSH